MSRKLSILAPGFNTKSLMMSFICDKWLRSQFYFLLVLLVQRRVEMGDLKDIKKKLFIQYVIESEKSRNY